MIKREKANLEKGNLNAKLLFETITNQDSTKLRIQTKDRSGLLCDIARMLYLECMDILSVEANTKGSDVDDIFEIKSESGHSLEEGMQQRLVRNLKSILERQALNLSLKFYCFVEGVTGVEAGDTGATEAGAEFVPCWIICIIRRLWFLFAG